MNEILGIKLVQLYSSYVNDITDMHVIFFITLPAGNRFHSNL